MKLKCTGAIAPTDKKQAPAFVKGKVYDAVKSSCDAIVTGEAKRKNGSLDWQALTAYPSGWVVLGVAKFEEVAGDE